MHVTRRSVVAMCTIDGVLGLAPAIRKGDKANVFLVVHGQISEITELCPEFPKPDLFA